MREKVSACITAFNEETKIRRCLKSVAWADEIIVVDSHSTDNTVEVCKEYTDRVHAHDWLGYIGQKNLIKDMANYDWILFVDADEEVSEELRDEIIKELESDSCKDMAGYEFPRMVKYLGKWIKHGDWYPDIKLRLFRKDRGSCTGVEPHDRVEVHGSVKRLSGHLHHYTYDSIEDQVISINRFSTITARGWSEDGRRARMWDIMLRPFFRFVRCYFFRMSILDGLRGFTIAVLTSYGVFVKYVKLWEFNLRKEQHK